MCSVSAISDYYGERIYPGRTLIPYDGLRLQPYLPPIPQWDAETKRLLSEVLERLDAIDKRLGDVECHDESKAELKRQLGLEA